MISIKNDVELRKMREAGRIVAATHAHLANFIKEGITTAELDMIAERFILEQGATPSFKGLYGFPCATCISINDVLVHGIPDDTKLQNGDIVSIDIGACYEGYHGDSAWTYPVGDVSDEVKKLLKVTEESLYIGLEQAKVGNRVSDISNAIQTYVESFGFKLPPDYTGHGIGVNVHEDPIVSNVGAPGRGPLLRNNMTIAVEPMVQIGTARTKVLSDGWTVKSANGKVSAHFEHTVVIKKDGCEILTKL